MVVSIEELNVYSGTNTGFDRIDILDRTESIQMIGHNRTSSWIQISLSKGRTGRVSRRYLSSNCAYGALRESG